MATATGISTDAPTADLATAMSTSPKRPRKTATAAPLPSASQLGAAQPLNPSQPHTNQHFAPQDQSQQLHPTQQHTQQPPGAISFDSASPVLSADPNSNMYQSPYRDGRVRNPVPSNLRGKADPHGGSFGVMHIDINTAEAKARDEIAKRTSERTERAAKLAQQQGYVPLARRRFDVPETPTASTGPGTNTLDAKQTKAEQARLLTLLRSLNPVSVVDQICKALAYFGGIPGAPAPPDGMFPESADRNGSGRLFVGWISEIFPHIDHAPPATSSPGRPYALLPDSSGDAAPPPTKDSVKRPRGRPKGSKATKVRKDKGIKKSLANAKAVATAGAASGAAEPNPADVDGSWVDMDESTMDATAAHSGQVQQDMSMPLLDHPPQAPKKRGRPKGSKNRPKEPAPGGADQRTAEGNTQTPASKTKSKGKGSKRKAQAQSEGDPHPGINGAAQQDSAPTGVEFALAALQSYNDSSSMVGDHTTSFTPANLAPGPTSHQSNAAAMAPGNIRKRKTNKSVTDGTQEAQGSAGIGGSQRSPLPNGYPQQGPLGVSGSTQPPAKRQRKTKESASAVEPPVGHPPLSMMQNNGQALGNDATSETSDSHFDRETFEALQSQLEQETETARRQDETQMQEMLPQLRTQTQQQNNQLQGLAAHHHDPRQQQNQSASPHPQHQQPQQAHIPQTHMSGSVGSHQQPQQPSRNTSQSYYTQMGNSPSSYGQQPQQAPQQQQQAPQQQQQPQPQPQPQAQQAQQHTSQFPSQQTQHQSQAQQHTAQFATQQPTQQPYSTAAQQQQQQPQQQQAPQQQQKYPARYQPQQQYPGTQQQQYATAQQRHQPPGVATSSPALVSQASPSDSGYRTASNNAMGYNSQFNPQRGTQASASPSLNAYTPNRTPSFGPAAARQQQQQQQQQQQSQTQTQQGQGTVAANMQPFHGFDANNAALFENMGLDGSGHASLGLGTPSYNMNSGVARSSAGASGFGTAFDPMQGNDMRDRYYGGVRR